MNLKEIIFIYVFFYSLSCISQNMQEGYTLLETGKYEQAITYFNTVLQKHPNNKTARLCYGRAVGLYGNPKKALVIFNQLLIDFPNDFEITLNYAEALLWDKQYNTALKSYTTLVAENPKSFPAILGYANTLSNLQKYNKALTYVNKALLILPGNPNALVSKKYIRLGLANEKRMAKNYIMAEEILNKNLIDFPNDKETLLNIANLHISTNQIDKAIKTYNLIGKNPINELIALNGLSLAQHLNNKNKKALILSKKAVDKLTKTTNNTTKKETQERYIQALLWNKKYTIAKKEINNLLHTNGNKNWILALRASLNTYKSNFKNSIIDYNTILEKDSASFNANLGKANALKAIAIYDKAYKSAQNTLKHHNNQKDAIGFIKNLDQQFTPFSDTRIAYSIDNGNNQAYAFSSNISLPISIKSKLTADYTYRKTTNEDTDISGTSQDVLLGVSHQIKPSLTFKAKLGFTSTKGETNNYNKAITQIALEIKPLKLQHLEIGYKKEFQNFNADLLDREISQNHFYANYSLQTNFNLGWYSQYFYTNQNDDNVRNLFFTSLYYKILEKPALKTGINYQNISFKNQVPSIYFSPKKFNAVEVFLNIIKEETNTKRKNWFYELTGAYGLQFIEDNKEQYTYRIQAKLGYKPSFNVLCNIYATKSNIASAAASGSSSFTYTEIGLRLKWYFTQKPVFKKL